uniref:Uncharacterized protein n=1 Tax=Arundo donax TaxID=35708 RepID=A0A0A9G384_ARUDO
MFLFPKSICINSIHSSNHQMHNLQPHWQVNINT